MCAVWKKLNRLQLIKDFQKRGNPGRLHANYAAFFGCGILNIEYNVVHMCDRDLLHKFNDISHIYFKCRTALNTL